MTYKWKNKSLTPTQKAISDNLAKELTVSSVIADLLVQRGINTFDEARKFFRPDLEDLHDPFLMKDMDKAVERLTNAINNNEKILVYGDYDVDGTTSVALVYKFLKEIHHRLGFYIPDRYNEGYGISLQGIDYARENEFTLVIALDCGIKAVEKIKYANENHVDFIICDHHTTDEILPDAIAVLDPKRTDCNYPFKHLSGCGVGFKLMQAFALRNDINQDKLLPLLDLLALSIASDIVPIIDENRILAYHGLKQLNSNPSVGINSILEICNLCEKEITISDIVFRVGPRINASGRMKLATEAVELLLAIDPVFAKEKSSTINNYNENRKELDKGITDDALNVITEDKSFEGKKSIVVYKPDWHKGVIGIVASRLAEEYYKPSVVLTKSNGIASGSARSVPGFDIYSAIESCRDLLMNFGGHKYAAGLSLPEENVTLFYERFEEYVNNHISEDQTLPQIDIDAVIGFNDISPKFFNVLKQFSPFGPGNPKPVFSTKKVMDYGTSKCVGKELEHLKLELVDTSSENVISGIGFKMKEFSKQIKSLKPFDICYTIEENNFNNANSIQLLVKDIHF